LLRAAAARGLRRAGGSAAGCSRLDLGIGGSPRSSVVLGIRSRRRRPSAVELSRDSSARTRSSAPLFIPGRLTFEGEKAARADTPQRRGEGLGRGFLGVSLWSHRLYSLGADVHAPLAPVNSHLVSADAGMRDDPPPHEARSVSVTDALWDLPPPSFAMSSAARSARDEWAEVVRRLRYPKLNRKVAIQGGCVRAGRRRVGLRAAARMVRRRRRKKTSQAVAPQRRLGSRVGALRRAGLRRDGVQSRDTLAHWLLAEARAWPRPQDLRRRRGVLAAAHGSTCSPRLRREVMNRPRRRARFLGLPWYFVGLAPTVGATTAASGARGHGGRRLGVRLRLGHRRGTRARGDPRGSIHRAAPCIESMTTPRLP